MTFSIFDSGNLVVSSEDETEIVDAFKRLAAEAPDGRRDRYQLIGFDDAGEVVFDRAPGNALSAGRLSTPTAAGHAASGSVLEQPTGSAENAPRGSRTGRIRLCASSGDLRRTD